MKILVSWLAFNNDFENGEVKIDGPTFNYHKYYFQDEYKHIILSSSNDLDPRAEKLASALRSEYSKRLIEVKYMAISDIVNINTIKTKVEPFLLENSDNDIEIFMSPGTPSMQIVWYLCHLTLGLNTSLYQLKELRHSNRALGSPERIKVEVERSSFGYSAVIREQGEKLKRDGDYKITSSIDPIYIKADLIAQTDLVTTLIYGESGTGKEHLANYIHEKSARCEKSFIAVNCSAFTDELLESRLFGHKKGAFTGAIEDHKGFFEDANGGTLFLDEIGDISLYMQQSLLRVIQERKILGIGINKEKKINVRIIAATNKDLATLCSEGKFRWDLYYRLSVVELTLPALRNRKITEIKELLDFFLESKKRLFKRPKRLFLSKEIESIILNYQFPGNVRELENLIEGLYVFNMDVVIKESLPNRLLHPQQELRLDLESVEKLHIQKVLSLTNSNAKACKILGITVNTLKSKLKKYESE